MKITASTAIKHDLDYFLGKASYCKFNIIDTQDDIYESEVYLPEGWEQKSFINSITQSFHLCDATPEEVMIMEFRFQTKKEIKFHNKMRSKA